MCAHFVGIGRGRDIAKQALSTPRHVIVSTPMTVFKKLAFFYEILKFLNVLGLIETLVNFLMA